MADGKQNKPKSGSNERGKDAERKSGRRPQPVASKELKGMVEAQQPRGMLGRIKAKAEGDRPGALPMPPRRNVSAFTAPAVMERWGSESAGVRAVEVGDNVITMFGMVGEDFWTGEGITAKKTAAQLRAIGPRPVEVHINSFGGDMFEGIAIFNILREHPQSITIKVMGMAASAASIIAMAGDTIEIGAAGFIMIHNCSVMAGGNRHDFLEMASFLEPFDQAMADVYAERTGLSTNAIAKMMDDETYMSGSTAIAKGFADSLMAADKTTVDDTAKADARSTNELRALELQLVASGMTRANARARISKVKGTPGAALDHHDATPGAGAENWSGDALALIAALST